MNSKNDEFKTCLPLIKERLAVYGAPGRELDRLREKIRESSYRDAAPYAERILRLLELVNSVPLEELPNDRLVELIGHLDTLNNELSRLVNHKSGDHGQNFRTLLAVAWETFFRNAIPDVVTAKVLGGVDSVDTTIEKIKTIEQTALDSSKQLKAILDDAITAAGKLGVSNQSSHFAGVAKTNQRVSWVWAGVIGIAVLASFFYALWLLPIQFEDIKDPISNAKLSQMVLNKVLVVSILFFTIGWSARNYSAARHNFVTNQHRQKALSTFQTLVDGVDNDLQARNAILVYACQAIFMPTPSGYGKGDVDVQQVTPALEIMSATRKASGA